MPRLTARRKHVESSPSAAAVADARHKTNNNNNNDEPRPKLARIGLCLPVPQRPKEIGSVLVCGQGDLGQLGLGDDDTKFERKRPALVTGVSSVVDICAGGVHNLVLTSDGKVFSFGCNDEGALGRDTSKEGSEFEPGEVKLPGKGVMLSAGDSHSACLLEDGRVFAWGSFRDSHGNMGLTMDGNKREPISLLDGYTCVAIGSGTDHLVILTSIGKVFTIGCGEQGQLGRVSLRSASGETRRGKTQMLKPCEVITRTHKPIVQIWVTKYCTFMREFKSDLIWAFGLNNYQQLVPKKSVDISSCPVLTKLSDVKQIAGGQHHTLVLSKAGTVHVIGRHDYGRLGLGTVEGDLTELRQVEKLATQKISMISCGESQSFAIDGDGKLYAWGMGSSHQLGTGVDEDSLEPELIESKQTKDKRIINVSSGGQHSIFLATDIITKVNGASNAKDGAAGKATAKEANATTENAEKAEKKKK